MCLLYGLYIWCKYGVKMLIIFQPFPHVVVSSSDAIRHGTNRLGKWKIEEMKKEAFCTWIIKSIKETDE